MGAMLLPALLPGSLGISYTGDYETAEYQAFPTPLINHSGWAALKAAQEPLQKSPISLNS